MNDVHQKAVRIVQRIDAKLCEMKERSSKTEYERLGVAFGEALTWLLSGSQTPLDSQRYAEFRPILHDVMSLPLEAARDLVLALGSGTGPSSLEDLDWRAPAAFHWRGP